jgi:UDPglucose 6-dehydrogenase
MKDKTIGVIGMGFVGGSVFRGFNLYNEVRGYDVDPKKTTHTFEEVIDCDFVFIAVPTPMEKVEGGKGDPSYVNEVLERIEKAGYREDTVFILKSTVPIGTTDRCIAQYGIKNLVHSPEFLTERNALVDFITPARQIIGGQSAYATVELEKLYTYRFPGVPSHLMTAMSAEQVKYTANCFFAVKIMFFNEMRLLSDSLQTDWDCVLKGVLSDGRIGISHVQVPGHDGDMGFGGKCFPKDINALIGVCEENGVDPMVLKAAWEQNKALRQNWDWAKIEGAVSKDDSE